MKTREPPLGAPPYLVGPLVALRRQIQLHILAFGEKKIREKKSLRFTIQSRRQVISTTQPSSYRRCWACKCAGL